MSRRGITIVVLSFIALSGIGSAAGQAEAATNFQTTQGTVSCTWDVVGHGSAAICGRWRDGRWFWLADTGEVSSGRGDTWYGGRARRGRIALDGGASRYDVTCWLTSTNVRCRHHASGHGFELGPRRAVRF